MKYVGGYSIYAIFAGNLNSKVHFDNWVTLVWQIRTAQTTKPKDHQQDSNCAGEQKIMRRPEKILPCPQCNNSDIKFCYFNDYNVNKPRNFCKSRHRYWIAGSSVRNVPIDAGRRRTL